MSELTAASTTGLLAVTEIEPGAALILGGLLLALIVAISPGAGYRIKILIVGIAVVAGLILFLPAITNGLTA